MPSAGTAALPEPQPNNTMDPKEYAYDKALHEAMDNKHAQAEQAILRDGIDPRDVAARFEIPLSELPDPDERD